MTMMSTAILLVIAMMSAVVVRLLSGSTVAPVPRARLRSALVLSLAVTIGLLVALKAKLVPITVINFSFIVLGILYFGVIECMRIHRRLAAAS